MNVSGSVRKVNGVARGLSGRVVRGVEVGLIGHGNGLSRYRRL